MKVLKRGERWTEAWTAKATCRRCHSELEAEASDVRRMQGDRPGEADAFYVTCPVCHDSVYLPTDAVREDVQAQSR